MSTETEADTINPSNHDPEFRQRGRKTTGRYAASAAVAVAERVRWGAYGGGTAAGQQRPRPPAFLDRNGPRQPKAGSVAV